MAETPNSISPTIDGDALREQISSAIGEGVKEMSLRLRQAADALDPEFMKSNEEYLRRRWERENSSGKEPSNG